MSSKQPRDYYKYLFTPDSDTTDTLNYAPSNSVDIVDEISESQVQVPEDDNFFIENIKELLESHDVDKNVRGDTIYLEEENSDMSISTSSSYQSLSEASPLGIGSNVNIERSTSTEQRKSYDKEFRATQISSDDSDSFSDSSLDTIESKVKKELLLNHSVEIRNAKNAYFHKVLQKMKEAEKDTLQTHHDLIGTFNVQNKYEHGTAAKLFLEGNFAFLSIQEPFAHQEKNVDAWKACRRNELGTARIKCYETSHQVVLFDAWKWGGKIIADFESKLDGRIASIAFEFGKNQKLGIISVYAMARGGSANKEEEAKKEQLRRTTVFLIKKLHRAWSKKFPNIHIMILGDMQETCSITDRDNIGGTRLLNDKENGVVAAFSDKYSSIVRERNPNDTYVTRYGHKGARGIDHILFPDTQRARELISSANIDKEGLGNLYFASDHKLLQCTYIRRDSNNEEQGEAVTKFAFNKISQIKLKRTGENGKHLSFDDNQFKGSKKYESHQKLYSKLQLLTQDKAETSDYFLSDLECNIKKLYKSLWNAGQLQNACGKKNKLVKISDNQAAQLSQILNTFELGIQDVMIFLDLVHDSDCLAKGAEVRNTIRLKNGDFKPFSNLPIATKFRYLRAHVQRKRRHLESYIKTLEHSALKNTYNSQDFKDTLIIKMEKWKNLLKMKVMQKKADLIYSEYFREKEERDEHTSAIKHKSLSGNNSILESKSIPSSNAVGDNQFKYISDSTVKLINLWLGEADCNQGFHTKAVGHKFDFLKEDDFSKWTAKCDEVNWKELREKGSNRLVEASLVSLKAAQKELKKLEGKLSGAQSKYRSETLTYLLDVNSIENFTKKVLPKARDIPATHTEIWDGDEGRFRNCKNDTEELIATGQFHGNWMDASKATEACAFATLKKEGLLGNRGISLNPDRKVTMADIPNLVHNGNRMSTKLKRAFLRAHGKHTARLFRPPKKDHEELHFPFYLTASDGTMHEEAQFEESFWKSLASTPGKARYNGFHMAVVGRFGQRWQKCLLHISKLILIMRYVPNKLKTIARFPIPKPGRVNEYRPISLCHDLYCFINAECTKITSKGIEKTNILHAGIAAYVKGRSCTTLVGVEQGVREDCIESGVPSSQTDEDEEKFFDRIPVEVLLAAMRVNGFPEQGFLELKASGMDSKSVEIMTGKGVAHARFVCGIEQGNPDSPAMANLVIKFKHDLWLNILEDIDKSMSDKQVEAKEANKTRNKDAYQMHITDGADGVVKVDRIGYCDDNTRYTSSHNEDDVIRATQFYIQQAGDLSLVTKIGRKGSKSEVHYFNLSAEKAIGIKPIESIAWSFTVDGPQIEHVPYKMCLQDEELKKVYVKLQFHSLDSDEQQKILDIFEPIPHKHLGLKSNLRGNSSFASSEVLEKVKGRMASLKVRNMNMIPQKTCMNLLCNTVHSYAPLQMGHKTIDLQECDDELIRLVMRRHGLTQTDAKHILFLRESKGGYGFKSFVDVDVVANARELEIGLNGKMIDSEVMRARTSAFIMRHNNPSSKISINYMGNAITKLAKYGFHIRDRNDGIINYILAILNKQKRFCTIGDERYGAVKNHSIGVGTEKNTEIAFGSQLHLFLRNALTKSGTFKDNVQVPETWNLPTSTKVLRKMLKEAKMNMFQDVASMYNCWEWIRNRDIVSVTKDIRAKENWKFIDVASDLTRKFGKDVWKLNYQQVHDEAIKILNAAESSRIRKYLLESESPIFIATDGSHFNGMLNQTPPSTTGSAVVCIMDIREGETLKERKWESRPTLPIMARSVKAPLMMGNIPTDIGHGEGIALCLGLELLCKYVPKVIIMDSQGVRSTALAIRDQEEKDAKDRKYIRHTASGISKYLAGRMEMELVYEDSEEHHIKKWEHKRTITKEFLSLSKEWTEKNRECDEDTTQWRPNYWDAHEFTSIFKVDSHQLHKDGDQIKETPRYESLCPNLFLLNCNHYADLVADLMHEDYFAIKFTSSKIILPHSKLRFFITYNGLGIDKHVSASLYNAFEQARVHEIKKRNTQGLPWRIVEQSGTSWGTLLAFKGLFRSLRGLSRTHTRSLYKSTTYRKGWILQSLENEPDEELKCLTQLSETKWINKLSGCKWCTNSKNSKGNRYHAFLFCEEKRLSKFRANMNMLLEQRLHSFIQFIGRTQNLAAAMIFLEEVERTLQHLHGIKHTNDNLQEHSLYRNRQQWVEEEGLNSEADLLNGEIPIYGYMFGFHPVIEDSYNSDKALTPAMCIPLGIVPREVDKRIKDMSNNLSIASFDKKARILILDEYKERWKEIKDINVARIVGLHRIVGNVSAEFEKKFQRKYNIKESISSKENLVTADSEKTQGKRIIQNLEMQEVETRLNKKRKGSATDDGSQPTQKENEGKSITAKRKKFCSGLTCNPQYKLWNFEFKKNKIESEKKQCQRCSRHLTAMKRSITELERCKTSPNKEKVQKFITHLDAHSNRINYAATSKQLSEINPVKTEKETKTIMEATTRKTLRKRTGLRDNQKTMLKTMQTSITRMTDRQINPTDRIGNAVDKLKAIHSQLDRFLRDDLQQTKKINKRMLSTSYNKKNTEREIKKSKISRNNEEEGDKKVDGEDEEKIREEIAHTLGLNQWMYSYTMDRAIKFIRDLAPNAVFLANSHISILLKNWNEKIGWQKIAESFRNPDVILRKPNGTYIMPIFTGSDLQGHWSVAVVNKQKDNCRGWVIDSLGSANLMEKEFRAIKSIFSNSRRCCRWIEIQSRKQFEVECGPRSITAMVSMATSLKEGLSIERTVEKATLLHISEADYDSKRIRQGAVRCLRLTEEGVKRDQVRELAMRKCVKRIRRREQCKQLIQQDTAERKVIDLV